MKKLLHHTLLSLTCIVLGLSQGFAADYGNFYIFGDSLSDAGNTVNNDALDDDGRFSNGRVWNEYLADMLGMSVPTKSSLHSTGDTAAAGHTNFSYGGAVTGDQLPSFMFPNVTRQINDPTIGFARYGTDFASNDLVAIWAGANNFILNDSLTDQELCKQAATQAASQMSGHVNSLIDMGAKNILVFNLPDIGTAPKYVTAPEGKDNATLFTNTFNAQYSADLTKIQVASPQVTITSIDVFSMFNDILADPASYNLTVTQTSLLADYASDTTIDQGQYLFHDDVHPTTATHQLLANFVYQRLIPEPSTATLSLLALAGLLARRRRKAA